MQTYYVLTSFVWAYVVQIFIEMNFILPLKKNFAVPMDKEISNRIQ